MEGVELVGGRMGLPKGPGLGVEPNWAILGKPVLVIQWYKFSFKKL
jgi:hypothetical protein